MEDGLNPGDFLARFSVAFSWDYPDDYSLNDVLCSIFYIIDDRDGRSQDQLVCSGVQSAGAGVCLAQPHPETDIVPCEMTFKAHPIACEFCITKIIIVSEARNLEMYVDEMYERTAKGMMLTLRKGKAPALYENEFDLSNHIQGSNKVTIKFVSMPDTQNLRLQTVIVKVTRCSAEGISPSKPKALSTSTVEMDKVKELMNSLGLSMPPGAQQLMGQIERQQQQQGNQMQQLLSLGLGQAMMMPRQQQQQATPKDQSPKAFRRSKSSYSSQRRHDYEESILANAILSTEKSKRETQQVMDERERQAESDAQINILKQMLLGPTQKTGSVPDRRSSVRGARHKSYHEGDTRGDNYKQMLENLLAETKMADRLAGSDVEADRSGYEPMSRSQNRASIRSAASFSTQHTSRPVSSCCSELSDRDFHQTFPELEDGQRRNLPPMFPANSMRCQECGCPGCLSVYNSITTNIYAMEERLVGRVDLKMQELSRHIENKFEALNDALFSRQEQLATQLIDSMPRLSEKKKPSKGGILYRTEER